VEQVARAFKESSGRAGRVLKGPDATKLALVENIPAASFVHLATHGWFSEPVAQVSADAARSTAWPRAEHGALVRDLAPLTLCGLALSGANRGADELGQVAGVITAEELAGLDLSRCELAVLSACETNVGITRAGQGIQSLQAALHAAGARSVVTSLWKVPDETTQRLMGEFYARLWLQKTPKNRALWQAKLAMRAKGHPPRDWAGWVLTGDAD
jgi:CHAT domain-containing protein